jgi:hypothetical protein
MVSEALINTKLLQRKTIALTKRQLLLFCNPGTLFNDFSV